MDTKSAWDGKIADALTDWSDDDRLPRESEFETPLAEIHTAVGKLTLAAEHADDVLANPDLEKIALILPSLPDVEPGTGRTIQRFLEFYGPPRLKNVFDGHRQAAAILKLGLSGTNEIWKQARLDITELTGTARDAFKQCRENSDAARREQVGVVFDAIGLIGSVVPGPAGTGLKGIAATGNFISSAAKAFGEETTPVELTISGGDAGAVLSSFKSAIEDLNDRISADEKSLATSMTTMRDAVAPNQLNFHVHPAAGLAKEFTGVDDISLDYPTIRTLGYTYMPTIARAFFDAEQNLQNARTVLPWSRPSQLGSGAYGAFFDYDDLITTLAPLLDDSAVEVVRAGEKLAEFAGFMRDVDGSVRDTLGVHHQELDGASLGWQQQEPGYFDRYDTGPHRPGLQP